MALLALYAALTAAVLVISFYRFYWWFAAKDLDSIPGPPSDSWLYGNVAKIVQGEAGKHERIWHEQYGTIVKIKGALGQTMLLISDPKALQYMYQIRSYYFPKPPERQAFSAKMLGRGLATVDGEAHKRQRHVMLPAFGAPESRAFVPIFINCASQMVNKWHELIDSSDSDSVIINLPHWTSRATLDAIGEAAFDYKFSALDDADNALSRAFQNLILETFGSPSNAAVLVIGVLRLVPVKVVEWIYDHLPGERLERLKSTGRLSQQVAKELVAEKSSALLQGQGSRDILSLCVKANAQENSRGKLSDPEMLAQLQTIAFAGHETVSTATTWTFYELAKREDIQNRLRAEVLQKRREKYERGDSEWTWRDFEDMPYLTAVMKEVLRFHPPLGLGFRIASESDVLPLSEPVTTTTGQVINELPVPKGLRIVVSTASYNRNTSIFGPDADVFNPDRWLENSRQSHKQFEYSSMGVLSNLMTFGAGPRACIGWRFAVLELQALIVEMISNFQFSHAYDPKVIRREASAIMAPVIEGQADKGSQLPLRITRINQD